MLRSTHEEEEEEEDHAGVSQGQPDVKLLGNPQWPPNFDTRTQTRGQLLRNAQATK